ncbi:MAG: zinc ribbon domain-containing protein [Gemmatimonadaceae bacterium]
MSHTTAVELITLFVLFVALVAMIVLRVRAARERRHINVGQLVRECSHCGQSLAPGAITCSRCGSGMNLFLV